jgi:hypothetical protein
MKKYEQIGKRQIFLDEIYYLAYAGGSRELPEKHQKEYSKILSLPDVIQRKELSKIPLQNNPNVVPLKGRDLMLFIKELKFVPMFDLYFETTKLLKLTDLIIFESIRQKSYDVALRAQ